MPGDSRIVPGVDEGMEGGIVTSASSVHIELMSIAFHHEGKGCGDVNVVGSCNIGGNERDLPSLGVV